MLNFRVTQNAGIQCFQIFFRLATNPCRQKLVVAPMFFSNRQVFFFHYLWFVLEIPIFFSTIFRHYFSDRHVSKSWFMPGTCECPLFWGETTFQKKAEIPSKTAGAPFGFGRWWEAIQNELVAIGMGAICDHRQRPK